MTIQEEKHNGNGVVKANGHTATSTTQTVICVFCGASSGTSPSHLAAARALAHAFHERSINLVYGGGTVGIMGEIARTLVSLSGPSSVHGIIPTALMRYEQKSDSEEPYIDEEIFGRTTVVKDMHTRKAAMAAEVSAGGPGSGFVALSGGFGTLEELMEVATWNQLGIHDKGVCVFNVDGYWDGLLRWVRDAVEAGFISQENGKILVAGTTPEEVIGLLKDYTNSKERFQLEWGQQ